MNNKLIRNHHELDVYKLAFETAMHIFRLSKSFPVDERYSLTDQVRRSSRSVCSNIAEAWRKRRYIAAFISKLSDSESEAAETQTWIQFSVACGYIDRTTAQGLYKKYDYLLGKLVRMIHYPESWVINRERKKIPSSPNLPVTLTY